MVIDISIFIDFLRARDKRSTKLFNLPDDLQLSLSAVTMFELQMGAISAEKKNDIVLITGDLEVLPFTEEVADKAGQIYHQLRLANQLIEFRDIFIAATCLVHNLPLLSLNVKHFSRVDDLQLV